MRMFNNPFGFSGRITRLEYYVSLAIYLGIDLIYNYILVYTSSASHIFGIILLPCLIFFIAQGTKRCHDIGKSGWWQLVPFFILWLFVAKGDEEENEYGMNPSAEYGDFPKWQSWLIGVIATIPLIGIIWTINYTPNHEQLSDETEVDVSLLNENEMTDGIAVFEVPENALYQTVEINETTNGLDIYDSEESRTFGFRIISLKDMVFEQDEMALNTLWTDTYNSMFGEDAVYEVIQEFGENDVEGKCQRIVRITNADFPIIFNFVSVYDNAILKGSIIYGWYLESNSVPFETILNSIRFKQ